MDENLKVEDLNYGLTARDYSTGRKDVLLEAYLKSNCRYIIYQPFTFLDACSKAGGFAATVLTLAVICSFFNKMILDHKLREFYREFREKNSHLYPNEDDDEENEEGANNKVKQENK
jgi:hypothetical protein